MAAGEGLVRAYDRALLVDHGGHITITKSWAMSLLKRMGVKRKATTKSTPGVSGEEFERVRASFLKQVGRMVQLRDIPDSLIINFDQTAPGIYGSQNWQLSGCLEVSISGN